METNLTMKPYDLAFYRSDLWEVISFPFEEDGTTKIMVRVPDNPTTLRQVLFSELIPLHPEPENGSQVNRTQKKRYQLLPLTSIRRRLRK